MPQGQTAKKAPAKAEGTRRIEVFRTGTFLDMHGREVAFSADDLKAIAAAYDARANPAPVVIGHPKTDDPAWGWIKGLTYDADADRLFADIGDLDTAFSDMVGQGKFKRVSMAFFAPDAPANPTPGAYHPKHVGFLGAKPPAVSGLKPVQFSADDDDAVFVFGEPAFGDIASLFRKMREWFIEKEGSEIADKVLADWTINWIDNAAHREPEKSSAFAAHEQSEQKGKTVMDPEDLERRQAEIDAREAALNKRDADSRHASHVAFADGLVADAKLPQGQSAALVALMDVIAAPGESETQVAFADGDKAVEEAPVDTLKRILTGLPKMVAFGTHDLGEEPDMADEDAGQIAFAAQAYQKTQADLGITVSASDAVAHVMKGKGQ